MNSKPLHLNSISDPKVAELLIGGAIGIIKTDTLYGLVALANNERAVNRVYAVKERSEHKSPIVLISSIADLFDAPTESVQSVCASVWPGPVSVILDSENAPIWIRRGNDSVAYRLPNTAELQTLLANTGPLIAPSANPEGKTPAKTIAEAEQYFGAQVDFYVDSGETESTHPSQLLRTTSDGTVERLR